MFVVTRKRALLVLALVLVALIGFVTGGIAHSYGFHEKNPVASFFANLIRGEPAGEYEEFYYPAPEQGACEIFSKSDVEYPFTFLVYGDSREPATYEKDAIIVRIIKENPSFVLHTGDIVRYGDEHHWRIFDLIEGNIISSGIPIYPVLGNHEYHLRQEEYPEDPQPQLQYYFDRFEFLHNNRWYSFTYGNCRFLLLDTNTDYSPGSYQYDWLMNELGKEDSGFLFVAFHHPPYTKGKPVRESEKEIAALFESCDDRGMIKPDIVFSGHVHNYERYIHEGINYIVSGGGGAEPHTIDRAPNDLFTEEGDTFHYCRITVSETELAFEMIRLIADTGGWETGDTFTLQISD